MTQNEEEYTRGFQHGAIVASVIAALIQLIMKLSTM